jgi:hypothetical protein
MKRALVLSMFVAAVGCSSGPPLPPPLAPAPSSEVAAATAPKRGQRYCEVLLAHAHGGGVTIDVYNSFGMTDCPEADWRALDAKAIQSSLRVDRAILNGPRVWLVDGMEGSHFADPTPRAFNGIGMRLGARIEMSMSEVKAQREPYREHTIQRQTVYRFDAGKRVYELTAPDGRVYVMQSYSLEKAALTEPGLETLATMLHVPAGWAYQTRVLTEPMILRTVDGAAHVIQDDLNDTYQRRAP